MRACSSEAFLGVPRRRSGGCALTRLPPATFLDPFGVWEWSLGENGAIGDDVRDAARKGDSCRLALTRPLSTAILSLKEEGKAERRRERGTEAEQLPG
jgi:hypothetical protein